MTNKTKGNILVGIQFLLLAVIFLSPKLNDWLISPFFEQVVNSFSFIAIAFLVIAGLNLGKSLTANPVPTDSSTLKTNGLYRFVRHPIYSALILLSVSTVFASQSWLKALTAIALIALLSYKARFEENLLLQRYADYAKYAARVGRLVPLVGRLREDRK